MQQTEFDETGECIGGPNIWIEPSTEPSIVTRVITSYPQANNQGGLVQGQVRFDMQSAMACGFSLKVNWSNEDILINVTSKVNCQPLPDLPRKLNATIVSIDCGEIDPWYVADACLVDLETTAGEPLRLATWSQAGETYEQFLSLYPFDTHADLLGQTVVLNASDLDLIVEPGALSVVAAHNNDIDPTATILWWNGLWTMSR